MGYKIKEARERMRMTQTELSEKSGVSRTTIWALETGSSRETTTKTLVNIAKALGMSVEDLFFTENV